MVFFTFSGSEKRGRWFLHLLGSERSGKLCHQGLSWGYGHRGPASPYHRSDFSIKLTDLSLVLLSIKVQLIQTFEGLLITHFLYRILDSKKTSRFQFSIPDLREIHRNLKQQKNFNSHDGFFRKSPFCTFSCINPRFGGPWGMIWIFFLNGTFEPVHEIQNFFWPKVFFWSIMKMKIRNFFRIMIQGPPNPGFMQKKVQKGDFLKKPSRKLKFFFCFRFKWIPRRPGTLN